MGDDLEANTTAEAADTGSDRRPGEQDVRTEQDVRAERDARAERIQERFTIPVIVAALAAIPATLLTTLDGTAAVLGETVNYASLVVFTAEAVVVFALSGNRLRWVRRNWFIVIVAVATVPAVIFAVGPVQLLRLVRFLGALRLIRVGRIVKAGKILYRRSGRSGPVAITIAVVATVAAAAFVATVLADPSSQSRQFVDSTFDRFGVLPVLLAGAILGGATFVVYRYRQSDEVDSSEES